MIEYLSNERNLVLIQGSGKYVGWCSIHNYLQIR